MFKALYIVQDKDCPISRWEFGDRFVEGDSINVPWLFGHRLDHVLHFADLTFLSRPLQLDTLLAKVHQNVVDGKSVQPGSEGRLATKASNFSKELDEDLLGEILGFSCIGDHSQAQAVDPTLVALVQNFEGYHIAGGGGLSQIEIGLRVVDFLDCHLSMPNPEQSSGVRSKSAAQHSPPGERKAPAQLFAA